MVRFTLTTDLSPTKKGDMRSQTFQNVSGTPPCCRRGTRHLSVSCNRGKREESATEVVLGGEMGVLPGQGRTASRDAREPGGVQNSVRGWSLDTSS